MADAKIRLSVDGTSQVVGEFDRVENKISKLEEVANRAKSSLALLGVGLGINEIARLSDEYTKYTAQLKLATNGETEYANARQTVSKIARESQSELAATGVLYARITNGTRELGISQQKVGQITEAVTLALKASGATQEESASATLQLSQAFAAGALRGEEFNSVNEAAPRLMKALADGLGVPIGALKNMASEGKITTEVLANNLPKALEDLRKEAAQVQTIAGAYTNLKNNVLEYIGAQAQQNGTAAILSTTINTLANNLNYVSAAAAGFTTIKISQKLAEMAAGMVSNIAASNELAATKVRETAAAVAVAQANVQETTAKVAQLTATQAAIVVAHEEAIAKLSAANATIAQSQAQIQAATSAGALSTALRLVQQGELSLASAMQVRSAVTAELAVLGRQQIALSTQATAATAAQAAAQTGLATATAAGSAGVGLLSRAVGFLGGPIGAVTTLLGLGVTAWLAWSSAAKESGDKAAQSTEKSTEEIIANVDAQIHKLKERNALAESGLADIAKNESESSKKMASLRAKMIDAQTGQGEYTGLNDLARMDILQKLGVQYGTLYTKIQAATEEQRKFDASGKVATDLIEVRERLMGVNKQYLEDLKKLDAAKEKGVISEQEFIRLASILANKTYEQSKAGKAAAKAAVDEGLSYENLMKTLKEKIAVAELDIATDKALTEGQKLAAKFASDLVNVKNTLTEKQKQEVRQTLELLVAKEKLNAQMSEENQFYSEQAKNQRSLWDAAIKTATDEAQKNEELVRTFGMTKSAIEEMELARLEEQLVQKGGIDACTAETLALDALIRAKKRNVDAVKQLEALGKGTDTTKAKELLDIMTELDNVTQKAAQGMASSFGKVGSAIGGLTTALSGYGRAQTAIDAQLVASIKDAGGNRAKMDKANAAAAAQTAQAQISAYGNMASAAKGFFKENSNGYKMMEGAEKTFRALEMAMAVEAMLTKSGLLTTFTGLFAASKATEVATVAATETVMTSETIAGEAARNAAKTPGVFMAFMSALGPWGAAAAGVAIAAVLGGAFRGGGSGGGQTAAQRQKEQGTGSVFGDDSAKSDSIAKSIEEMSKSSNRLLPVNQGMLASLKNIESSMSGMTNLLVRTPGITNGTNLGIQTGTLSKTSNTTALLGSAAGAVGGAAAGASYGMAAGSVGGPIGMAIGAVLGAVTGSILKLWGKTTQNIVDSGVQFGGKLSELQAGRGFSQYASVDTTTSKWFGLQKNTSNSQQTQGLNAEMSNQMGMIFSNMAGALKEANRALGGSVDEITKTFENLTLSTEKISLKGLTGTALTDAFNVVISKSLDEMAKAAFPAYDHFRAQGEGYAQTVLRVANTVAQVNDSLWSVGAQLLPLNELGINAAVGLAKLFDGLENLQSATNYFAENFLSDAERIAPIAERLHQRMAELGYGSVTTEAGFKNLVLSLDRTNSSQAALYVELLKLAPAFKTVADSAASTVNALDTAKQQVDEAKRNYQSALLAVGDALEGLAQKAVSAKLAEQSAQEKISEAYFNAQDAVAAAQKKIIDLTRQSADAMTAFSGNIRSFIASMSGTLGGQSYKTLRASLNATAEAAKAGDTKAQNQLTSVAQKALEALKENSPSASAYARESASIRNTLRSVADVVDARVRAMDLPAVADPMTVANKELLDAQARLLSVAQIAAVTGASVDRSMTLVAGSTAALLAEFQKAHADNVKAQADYATAQAMSAQFAIPDMGSLNGFLSLMSELSAAKSSIVKAEADLSAAIIKSAKATELSSEDFAKSLGLTGDSAALLSKAMTDAHLSTAGYRALMLSTGLSATGLAINLLQSGVAATDMAVILAKAGTDGEKFADRLLLAGVDVAQFAANIKQNGLKSDSLALIFDTSKSAADMLASSLGLTSNAASNLAGWLATASFSSGEIEKKFASVGVSTDQLKTMLLGTGFSVSDFFRLLSIAGGSATSLHSLLDTSGLSGAGVNAASLLTTISGTTSTVASFADLLKLTGGDAATAAQLAANINHSQGSLQDFLAILSGAKTTANDFNDLLRITGVSSAAILAALGSGDKGLQSVAIAAGTSLGNFAATARAADLTMAGLDQLLAKNGLTASSFDGLKALTGSTTTELAGYLNLAAMSGKNLASIIDGSKSSVAAMTVALFGASGAGGLSGAANTLAAELLKQNVKAQSLIGSANESSLVAANLNEFGTSLGLAKSAADYVTQLLNSFKLPNMEGAGNAAAGVAKSLNQQLVEDWYKSNPNAIKTTDLQGIAYWVREIEKSGVIAAKTAFSHSVAKTSNTPVIPIDQFSQSFQVAPPPPAASGGGNALLDEMRALRAETAAMLEEIKRLREEQRIGDLANVSASKGTTQALQEMSDGNNLRVKVVG